jgi:hypothetical protein
VRKERESSAALARGRNVVSSSYRNNTGGESRSTTASSASFSEPLLGSTGGPIEADTVSAVAAAGGAVAGGGGGDGVQSNKEKASNENFDDFEITKRRRSSVWVALFLLSVSFQLYVAVKMISFPFDEAAEALQAVLMGAGIGAFTLSLYLFPPPSFLLRSISMFACL